MTWLLVMTTRGPWPWTGGTGTMVREPQTQMSSFLMTKSYPTQASLTLLPYAGPIQKALQIKWKSIYCWYRPTLVAMHWWHWCNSCWPSLKACCIRPHRIMQARFHRKVPLSFSVHHWAILGNADHGIEQKFVMGCSILSSHTSTGKSMLVLRSM